MDLVFKIGAIGLIVAVVNILLEQCGRKEIGMLATVAGLIAVLIMVTGEAADMLESVKTMFGL